MPTDETILVADDSGDERQALLDILAAKGYQAKGVGRGTDAMAELHLGNVGVLLLDMRLPGMDGLEVMRNIQAAQIDAQVIVITGYATLENAVQALNLGAFAYCLKPLDIDSLLHLISRALEARRLRWQLVQKEREVRAHAEFHLKILNERVQLMEEATQREHKLAQLYELIALASGDGSPLEMARSLLVLMQETTKAEYASITLVNPDGSLGKRADSFQGMEPFRVMARPGGLTESVLKRGETQYIADAQDDARANPDAVKAGIRCYLAIPLKAEQRIAGILFLHSLRPDAFREERPLLESCSQMLAANLLRAELVAKIEGARLEWEATFDAIGDAVVLMDEERRILRANKSFANLVGAGRSMNLVGVRVCALVHGSENPVPECPLQRVIESGQPKSIQTRQNLFGDTPFEIRLFPIPAQDGAPRRFVHIIRTMGTP